MGTGSVRELLRQYKPINQFVKHSPNKHSNSNCINNMHCPQIKIGWAIWILFSKEVHLKQIYKKKSRSE